MGLAVDYHTVADRYIRKGLLGDTLVVVCMQQWEDLPYKGKRKRLTTIRAYGLITSSGK
jgi:hypothetical protein